MKDNPFYTRTAFCDSSLHFIKNGKLVPFAAAARVDAFLAITLRAKMDLIVGLAACAAEISNNYKFKPIGYEIT